MDVNRPTLLARVAVCYFAGILLAATVGQATQGTNPHGGLMPLMFIVAVFGIPFLFVVMTAAYVWAESILHRPLIWAASVTLLVSLAAGLAFFGIDGPEAAAIAVYLAAVCAFFGSVAFLIWNRLSPLRAE